MSATVMRAVLACVLFPFRVAEKRPLAALLLGHALCAAALYTPNLSSGPMPFPFADKAAHFMLFFGLYAVTLPVVAGAPLWALAFSGGGYGVLSECIQGLFVAGRGFAAGDVFADLLGSVAALCAASVCMRAGRNACVPEKERRAAA